MKTCCPFHVDGGDPEAPCAPDIPASHHDFAEMEQRMLDLIVQHPAAARNSSMREEFALFYRQPGAISGRFPKLPSFVNGCGPAFIDYVRGKKP